MKYCTFQSLNNKGADQTARMRRLICAFVVRMQQSPVFSRRDSYDIGTATRQAVASSIPARSHTFVEIDHEIISTVILLPSADSFKKGCCQLQAKVCAQITG